MCYKPLIMLCNPIKSTGCMVMGWMMGLEPTTTGITIRDSTN